MKDFIQFITREGLLQPKKKKRVEFIANRPPVPVLTHVVFVYRTVWTELAVRQCLAGDWSGVFNCKLRPSLTRGSHDEDMRTVGV